LALIYVPFFRRPVSLFAIGLAIAGLAVWQVEPAMLLLQSALVGCILVLLAVALEYFQSQRATPTIVRSAGSSIIESRSETRFGRSVDAASPASTESLPVEFELPAAESSNR
jgi:hypothetical protein